MESMNTSHFYNADTECKVTWKQISNSNGGI